MGIDELCRLSRRYGQDANWVLAGGGNTSFKDDATLYVKASGFALATLEREGLVAMDRTKLAAIWNERYPEARDKREERALADLMAARLPEDQEKRPSVETLMHDILPFAYVIHTHPTLVNGLTCAKNGEAEARRLFGDGMLWVPLCDPGYVLAVRIREALQAYRRDHGETPKLILLQNHGLVIGSDDPQEIEELHTYVDHTIRAELEREPDLGRPESASELPASEQAGVVTQSEAVEAAVREAISQLADEYEEGSAAREGLRGIRSVRFAANREMLRYLSDRNAFQPLSGPFTPDHIVYAGHKPPFVDVPAGLSGIVDRSRDAIRRHVDGEGQAPKTVAFQSLGVVALGKSDSAAEKALALFSDAVQIASITQHFGGHRFMEQAYIDFILSWEVESYRERISTGG